MIKTVTSNKNGLNELSKKVKAISIKRLNKNLINKSSILNRAKDFSLETFQNYVVFMPTRKHIKYTKCFSGNRIDSWKSNGMLEENIENITKSDSNFAPTFVDHHLLLDMCFSGQCLINKTFLFLKT